MPLFRSNWVQISKHCDFSGVAYEGFDKKRNSYCSPSSSAATYLTSRTLRDAAKECLYNPNCHMFGDLSGNGFMFHACGKTALIRESSNSILYQRRGNQPYTCFWDLRCVVKAKLKYR